MIRTEPYRLLIGPAATSDGPDTAGISFVNNEADRDTVWDIEQRASGVLAIDRNDNQSTTAWFDADNTLHVRSLAIEGDSAVDAGTLDGLDSAQFVRSDTADTARELDVTDALSVAGSPVLTQADEGSLDAGTLGGDNADDLIPSISDDGTEVHAAPDGIDAGQYLDVSNNADGTVTIDSVGGNAVGVERTASGDDNQQTFTLQHDLGTQPAAIDVTPLSEDAAAEFYVSAVTMTNIDVTYTSPPPAGTGNLSWYVTAVGNDGSGLHTVRVDDGGARVGLANQLNFDSGLSVTADGDDAVTITADVDTNVAIEDDGAEVLATAEALNFGANLSVGDDGDGTVTIDGSDTYASVSANGTEVVAAPSDVNYGDNLSVVNDGDETVTVHASGNADTLGGVTASQLLRSDADDDHAARLGLTELGAADGETVRVTDDLAPESGLGLANTDGSSDHRITPRRDGLQSLTGGANLPTDYAATIEADATIAFMETDNDRVASWVNTNTGGATFSGGVRIGDSGGRAQATLDVRGSANFNGNQLVGAAVETRSSDPSTFEIGQVWFRTDVF